jgi:uncharacterized membrane protein
MILAGIWVFVREAAARPIRYRWAHVVGIGSGGLIVIVAFCWDWRNIIAGGEPNPFHWPLFATGLCVGIVSFVHATSVTGLLTNRRND